MRHNLRQQVEELNKGAWTHIFLCKTCSLIMHDINRTVNLNCDKLTSRLTPFISSCFGRQLLACKEETTWSKYVPPPGAPMKTSVYEAVQGDIFLETIDPPWTLLFQWFRLGITNGNRSILFHNWSWSVLLKQLFRSIHARNDVKVHGLHGPIVWV